jgi:outer membrane lipoprotein-sorting protein
MTFLAAAVAATIAATPALAATAPAAGSLTAAQIVDRNVAARGGLEAWHKVNSLTMSGEMDAGGKQDVKLPFVLSMKRPHKSRLELRFQDQNAVQVYDGKQGWKVRPYLNRNDVEAYTAAEAKSAAAAAELDGPLVDYASKGTRVELQGMEAVEGKNAYKLRLTLKSGQKLNLWVDASSFLELKIDGEPRKLDGRLHKVAIYYRDYKSARGLTFPHVLETAVEGVKETHKMSIQSVLVNPPLADNLFAKPALTLASAATR